MHIPDQMLQGSICPVTVVVGLAGVAVAVVAAARDKEKPGVGRFAAVAAFIFAGQMINFPIVNGTSGHLLGGVLAAALLGTPWAVLSMALVLILQALVFGDGGLLALGANVTNMALIGVAAGAVLKKCLRCRPDVSRWRQGLFYGLAGWLSVMLAALAVAVELGASGTIAFGTVAGAMLGVHALIGLGEGLITAVAYFLLAPRTVSGIIGRRAVVVPLSAACVIALLLSPFASRWPDGLERVADGFNLLPAGGNDFLAPLAEYRIPLEGSEILAIGLAGLCGALLTFSLAWLVGWQLLSLNRHGGN
jgi:cobalt/nickel transport system permease protein